MPAFGLAVVFLVAGSTSACGAAQPLPPDESRLPDEVEDVSLPSAGTAGIPLAVPGSGLVEVTLGAGIHTQHSLPNSELTNIVDAVGSGAAFADLDGDGWLDLIVVGGARSPLSEVPSTSGGVHIYRNRGDGGFDDISRNSGVATDLDAVAVAVGDIDGDGDRDLYLIRRGANRMYRNRGRAVFDDVTGASRAAEESFGVGAIFFDMEGDGDLDLFVINYLEFDARQQAHFAPDGFPGPLAYQAQADVLYRNDGAGRFEDVSAWAGIDAVRARGMSVVASDFDDDGDTDLFVANDATENFLWVNDGEGRFLEGGLLAGLAMGQNGEQTSAMAADLGDLDGDGQLDLAVSDTAFGALYLRHGPGLFADAVMQSGVAALCGQYVSWGQNLLDFDNDADLDLFVVNGGLHHLVGWEDLLLLNRGDARFDDGSDIGGAYFTERGIGRSSVSGDYDNDGDVDLFVTTLAGRPYLLRNDSDDESGWIILDLWGRKGRDPLGARVRLVSGGRTQVREMRARVAYLGQSDSRLHFGLGPGVDRVELIEIVWPDGSMQVLADVPARQILSVKEDS